MLDLFYISERGRLATSHDNRYYAFMTQRRVKQGSIGLLIIATGLVVTACSISRKPLSYSSNTNEPAVHLDFKVIHGAGEAHYILENQALVVSNFNRLSKLVGNPPYTEKRLMLSYEQFLSIRTFFLGAHVSTIRSQDYSVDPHLPDAGRFNVTVQIDNEVPYSFNCAYTSLRHKNISGERCVKFSEGLGSLIQGIATPRPR